MQSAQSSVPGASDPTPNAIRNSHCHRLLFIDATGVLSNFGSPPTGIPRLERFLVDAALANPDQAVKIVRYDQRRRSYRELSAFEQRQLCSDNDPMHLDVNGTGLLAIMGGIFRIIRENPAISRDAVRNLADLVTRNRRRGFSYAAIKLLLRAYRLYRKRLVQPSAVWSARQAPNINPDTGSILLSNSIVLGSVLPDVVEATGRKAFICHDLIPIIRPDMAIDLAHARRFSKNVSQIMQSDATILCTSSTSLSMLSAMPRSREIPPARIIRFPMPSILYERAKRVCRVSQISTREPFILYCSTIEVRKNHLLLAQVWQQAIEEGVMLPKLVCIGKWGWGVNNLIEYLGNHPMLAAQVVFTGAVSDDKLIDYYRSAMFGVVPSRIEGWGYCASECLDFGIPVIISTDPALREATRGLMPAIDPDDRAGWYAEIRRMTEDSKHRLSLCHRIAEAYRPISPGSSWARIKDAFSIAPVAASNPVK